MDEEIRKKLDDACRLIGDVTQALGGDGQARASIANGSDSVVPAVVVSAACDSPARVVAAADAIWRIVGKVPCPRCLRWMSREETESSVFFRCKAEGCGLTWTATKEQMREVSCEPAVGDAEAENRLLVEFTNGVPGDDGGTVRIVANVNAQASRIWCTHVALDRGRRPVPRVLEVPYDDGVCHALVCLDCLLDALEGAGIARRMT